MQAVTLLKKEDYSIVENIPDLLLKFRKTVAIETIPYLKSVIMICTAGHVPMQFPGFFLKVCLLFSLQRKVRGQRGTQ